MPVPRYMGNTLVYGKYVCCICGGNPSQCLKQPLKAKVAIITVINNIFFMMNTNLLFNETNAIFVVVLFIIR